MKNWTCIWTEWGLCLRGKFSACIWKALGSGLKDERRLWEEIMLVWMEDDSWHVKRRYLIWLGKGDRTGNSHHWPHHSPSKGEESFPSCSGFFGQRGRTNHRGIALTQHDLAFLRASVFDIRRSTISISWRRTHHCHWRYAPTCHFHHLATAPTSSSH